MSGLVERDVLGEGVDRGEPGIARPVAVAADVLEMVEKIADEGGREILEGQCRWSAPHPLGREPQQQTKRIAIPGNRVRTGLTLLKQAMRKEMLQQGGKAGGHHWSRSVVAPATRAAAKCSNSGTASRYQYVSFTCTWPR